MHLPSFKLRRLSVRPPSREYHQIILDKFGNESGTSSRQLVSDLETASPPYSDVFLISHGWNCDYGSASQLYKQWSDKMAEAMETSLRANDAFRPLIIGLHWPSMRWPDEERPGGVLGMFPGVRERKSIEQLVEEWASVISETPAAKDAIRTIILADQESMRWPDEGMAGDESPGGALEVFPGDRERKSIDPLVEEWASVIPETPEAKDATRKIPLADQADAPHAFGGIPKVSDTVQGAYSLLIRESGEYRDAHQPDLDAQTIVDKAQAGPGSQPRVPSTMLSGNLLPRYLLPRHLLLSLLRIASFYTMQNRAYVVGENGGYQLLRLLQNAPATRAARFHLMGHSFGCIVVSAAVCGPQNSGDLPRPVDTLLLVQAAMPSRALAQGGSGTMPGDFNPKTGTLPGYFERLISRKLVRGPIVSTSSWADMALRFWYVLATGCPAMGVFGIEGIPGVVKLPLQLCSFRHDFKLGGVYNLDATNIIRQGQFPAGAHSDIAHSEVAHAFWEMVSCSFISA